MKEYKAAEMEIVNFNIHDILMASNETQNAQSGSGTDLGGD